jgi:hypothetical protein
MQSLSFTWSYPSASMAQPLHGSNAAQEAFNLKRFFSPCIE